MEALHERHGFRRSAERLVTCSICTEVFKQPKVLPCQHTFCLPCLEKFIDSCNQNRIYKVTNFVCPSCRKVHFIPAGGIKDFPGDFKVTQICDFLEKLDLEEVDNTPSDEVSETAVTEADTGTEEVVNEEINVTKQRRAADRCEICCYQDKISEAKYFCTSCGKYLCEVCHRHHEENPVFQEHYTLLVDTGSDESAILICQDHQEEVKYFCDDCETALCTVCALGTHGKHLLSDISTSLAKQRHLVTSGLDTLRDRLSQYESEAEELAKLKEQQETSYTQAKETIKNQALIAQQTLERQQKELLNTLDNSHQEMMETLQEREHSIQENLATVTQICEEAAEAIEPEKVLKLLAGFSGLKKRLNDSLIEPVQDVTLNVTELPVFEACQRVSLGSLRLGDEDCSADKSAIDDTDNSIIEMVKTPKASTPKEVRFSIPEANYNSSPEQMEDTGPYTAVNEATVTSPQQPLVVNMSIIKNDSGFQSQVSEVSQNGEASESDDDVFVNTNADQNHIGNDINVSTYDVQLRGTGSITTKLKWECSDVQDCRGIAFYPDATLATTRYQKSTYPVKIYDCDGVAKKSMPGDSDYVIKPWAAAVNQQSCHLVVSDHGDSTVKVLDQNLAVTQTWKRMFNKPCGVATMRTGEYVITDGGSRHYKVSIHLPSGSRIKEFAKKGTENGCLLSPNYITVDHHDRIIISDCDNHAVRIFDRLGKQLTAFTWKSPNSQLLRPQGISVTGRNNIVVADQASHGLLLFNCDGRFITTLVKTDSLPWGVSVHENGLMSVSMETGIQVYSVE